MHCHQVQGWRYLRHLPSHLPYSSLPLGLRYTEHWRGNSIVLLSSLIPYATYHNDSHNIPHRNFRHFLTLLQLPLIVLLSLFGHHPPSYYQFIRNDAHQSLALSFYLRALLRSFPIILDSQPLFPIFSSSLHCHGFLHTLILPRWVYAP
jgi:hypothetical protein